MCDWTEPDGGSTVPIRHSSDLQNAEQLEYGDIVPGVRCPDCGNELVHTSNGALCDWCSSYVPVVGSAVHVTEDEDDDSDWTDDEE